MHIPVGMWWTSAAQRHHRQAIAIPRHRPERVFYDMHNSCELWWTSPPTRAMNGIRMNKPKLKCVNCKRTMSPDEATYVVPHGKKRPVPVCGACLRKDA